MVAMLVSLWLAPAAHAQLGEGVGSAVGGVGDTVGGVGDAVGGTVDGAVGEITGGLEGESSGSSTDGGGDGGSGEDGGGLVGGVLEGIGNTIEAGTEGVQQITQDTGDALGTVGSETVTGTVEVIGGTLGTIDDVVEGGNKEQRAAGSRDREGSRTSSPATDGVVVLGKSLADALEADNGSVTVTASADRATYATTSAPTAGESVINQLGKIATEAVRQAAFPLALILMVIGFLMVQNRLDRKDPKLALAPVDSEQDLLSFT